MNAVSSASAPELHVVFGTGPLGQAVIRALTARGKSVRAVNRSGAFSGAPAGVVVERADIHDPVQVAQVVRGATHVYQCAQPGYAHWPDQFPPLQAAVLSAAASVHARLIIGDNLYMYAPTTEPLHEALPAVPHIRKGRVRAEMARIALEAHERGVVRVVIGRSSDFYGPAVEGSSLGDRFFAPLTAGGRAEVMGDPDMPHTYTFIDDFGLALVRLGETDAAFGQAWHVPNAPALSHRQIAALTGELLGRPVELRTVSGWMLRLVGLFSAEVRELPEMLYEFNRPFIVNDSKYRQMFPDHQPTSLRDGLEQTLAWYRARAVVA